MESYIKIRNLVSLLIIGFCLFIAAIPAKAIPGDIPYNFQGTNGINILNKWNATNSGVTNGGLIWVGSTNSTIVPYNPIVTNPLVTPLTNGGTGTLTSGVFGGWTFATNSTAFSGSLTTSTNTLTILTANIYAPLATNTNSSYMANISTLNGLYVSTNNGITNGATNVTLGLGANSTFATDIIDWPAIQPSSAPIFLYSGFDWNVEALLFCASVDGFTWSHISPSGSTYYPSGYPGNGNRVRDSSWLKYGGVTWVAYTQGGGNYTNTSFSIVATTNYVSVSSVTNLSPAGTNNAIWAPEFCTDANGSPWIFVQVNHGVPYFAPMTLNATTLTATNSSPFVAMNATLSGTNVFTYGLDVFPFYDTNSSNCYAMVNYQDANTPGLLVATSYASNNWTICRTGAQLGLTNFEGSSMAQLSSGLWQWWGQSVITTTNGLRPYYTAISTGTALTNLTFNTPVLTGPQDYNMSHGTVRLVTDAETKAQILASMTSLVQPASSFENVSFTASVGGDYTIYSTNGVVPNASDPSVIIDTSGLVLSGPNTWSFKVAAGTATTSDGNSYTSASGKVTRVYNASTGKWSTAATIATTPAIESFLENTINSYRGEWGAAYTAAGGTVNTTLVSPQGAGVTRIGLTVATNSGSYSSELITIKPASYYGGSLFNPYSYYLIAPFTLNGITTNEMFVLGNYNLNSTNCLATNPYLVSSGNASTDTRWMVQVQPTNSYASVMARLITMNSSGAITTNAWTTSPVSISSFYTQRLTLLVNQTGMTNIAVYLGVAAANTFSQYVPLNQYTLIGSTTNWGGSAGNANLPLVYETLVGGGDSVNSEIELPRIILK